MRRLGLLVAVFAAVGCHRDLDVCPDDLCAELDSAPAEEAATGDGEVETGTTDSGAGDAEVAETTADIGGDSGSLDADAVATAADADSGAVADSSVVDSTVGDTAVADTFVADTFVADTYVADTYVADTFVADTYVADTYVAPPSCTDAGPASEPCGKCGTRTRSCVAPGTWSAWGACSGEGVCTPGEVASVATACGGALEKKTKTCTTSCTWGAEVCALPNGWTAIADAPIEGRIQNSAVWTGGEMITYGGGTSLDGSPGMKDGAIFSVYKNNWQLLATNPLPTAARKLHAAAWTGTDMIVWGGIDASTVRGDGFTYYPISKTWGAIPAAPIAARQFPAFVWIPTTKKMFIWGGDDTVTAFADGAQYDPSTATWSTLPVAPISARRAPLAAWTGNEVLVWGGRQLGGTSFMDGAAFNPATNSWRALPAASATGRFFVSSGLTTDAFVVFGGIEDAAGGAAWDGFALSLTSPSSWSTLAGPSTTLLPARAFAQSWVAGNRLTLWSGMTADGTGGAVFDPKGATLDTKTGTWSALDVTGAPSPRAIATTVWTGSYAVLWSGYGKPGGGMVELLQSGAIYVP